MAAEGVRGSDQGDIRGLFAALKMTGSKRAGARSGTDTGVLHFAQNGNGEWDNDNSEGVGDDKFW
jgi:hypothetical protein